MSRYSTKLDIDQERQNTTLGTRQMTPSLAQEPEAEARRTDRLLQTNQTLNQGQVGKDQQVT
jgi:hypothetical protein